MFARQFSAAATRRVAVQARRHMSTTQQFQRDELAAERDFINKEERTLLTNLAALQQKKQQLDYSQQTQSVSKILVSHKVEPHPALIQDLMNWKLTGQ